MKCRHVTAVTLLLIGLFVALPLPSANASCTSFMYRAGTQARNMNVATGTSAVVRVPTSADIGAPTVVTAADIYLTSSAGAFIQVGWYVGAANGLPYTATPRLFWGENTPSGEALHAGTALTWGAYYEFMITNPLNGSNVFNIWLQGSLVDTTNYAHLATIPGFNAETDDSCSLMSGIATHLNTPYASLMYRYGTWQYFDGTMFADPGYMSEPTNGSATDNAYKL